MSGRNTYALVEDVRLIFAQDERHTKVPKARLDKISFDLPNKEIVFKFRILVPGIPKKLCFGYDKEKLCFECSPERYVYPMDEYIVSVPAIIFGTQSKENDKTKQLEERIEALEKKMGRISLPSYPHPSLSPYDAGIRRSRKK